MSVPTQHTPSQDERTADIAIRVFIATAFGLGTGGLIWIGIVIQSGLADWIRSYWGA